MLLFRVDHFAFYSFGALFVRGVLHFLWIAPLFLGVNALVRPVAFRTLLSMGKEMLGGKKKQ
jgi:hypothetical protein